MNSPVVSKHPSKAPYVVGFFFALFLVLGVAIDTFHDLAPLFRSVPRTYATLFCLFVLTLIFGFCLVRIYTLLEQAMERRSHNSAPSRALPLWAAASVLAIAWLPYFVMLFPGTIGPDNVYMHASVQSLFAGEAFVSQHSMLPTFLLSWVPDALQNLTGSVVIATFIQTLGCALCMGAALLFCLHTLKRMGTSFAFQVCALCLFAFVPVFPLFAQWICKDTLGFSALLWFLSLVSLALMDVRAFFGRKANVVAFFISATLCALIRHDRIVIVLVCSVILAVLWVRAMPHGMPAKKLPVILALFVPVLFAWGFDFTIEHITHAETTPTKETYTMLYNTTARYVRDCPNDITQQEAEVIAHVMMTPEELAQAYLPHSADPVKNTFHNEQDFDQYLQVFIAQGLRHPLVYLSSFAEQTYGFWALDPAQDNDQDWYFAPIPFNGASYNFDWPESYRENGALQLSFIAHLNSLRNVPAIGAFMRTGLYVWALFFATGFAAFTKNRRALLFCVPFFLLWLVCLASPLAASIRYGLGIIGGSPLFVAWPYCCGKPQIHKKAPSIPHN